MICCCYLVLANEDVVAQVPAWVAARPETLWGPTLLACAGTCAMVSLLHVLRLTSLS